MLSTDIFHVVLRGGRVVRRWSVKLSVPRRPTNLDKRQGPTALAVRTDGGV